MYLVYNTVVGLWISPEKNMTGKKVQSSGCVGIRVKIRTLTMTRKITTRKKRYSCLAYTICNTRNIIFLLCLYLKGGNKLNVGIVCLKVKHLHEHIKHASPWWSRSLAQAAWPWVISQCPQGTLFARGCPRAGCEVFVNSMVWWRNIFFLVNTSILY